VHYKNKKEANMLAYRQKNAEKILRPKAWLRFPSKASSRSASLQRL